MADDTATEPTQPEAVEGTETPTTQTEAAATAAPETNVPSDLAVEEAPTPEPTAAVEAEVTPLETTEVDVVEAAPAVEANVSELAEEAAPAEPVIEEAVVAEPVAEVEAAEEAVVPEPVAEAAAEVASVDEDAEPAAPPRPSVGERPAITAPRDIGDVADDLSAEDFAAVIERTVFEFKEGDIVGGTVVRVDPDEVLVDIGYKAEGVIPAHELSIRNHINPDDVVKEGEPIEALVLQMEDDQGRLVLSKKRAQYERAWGRIAALTDSGGTVTGPVIEVVKGGLIVDIGLRGFLPASLVELRRVRDLDPYIGQTIEAKVIELDRNRNNVVLSRRAFLEEAQAEQRQAFLDDLDVTEVRTGVISSVVNFGAFVDLGGMDGLVHVSELSYQHVNHPSEVVKVGDEVTVRVLEVDRDRERISLSIKQTQEDPWEAFSRVHSIGDNVPGTVTKTVPFGAFVSVGEGVEGLVHVSEIAMHRVESPELELSLGQAVEVKVTEMDEERRRVSLSIKQALPGYRAEAAQAPSPDGPARRRVAERQEFQRESEEVVEERTFNVDSSLEAILQELKERGIGRR